MFCTQCGTQLAVETGACSRCGLAASGSPVERWASAAVGGQVQRQVAATSRDAVTALRLLVIDPVGGLPAAYTALGPLRSRSVGIALCVLFSLVATLALRAAVGRSLAGFAQFFTMGGDKTLLKWLLLLLVPPAVLVGGSYGLRRLLGGAQQAAGDVFTAGAALVPTAVALLLSSVLGIGNLGIVFLLFLLAFCYLVLILYTGLSTIGGVSPRVAAPAVPALLVLTGWLVKVVAAKLL